MKEVLAADERSNGNVLDWNFIRTHTTGFDQFAETLRNTSWDDIVNGCGIRNPKSNKRPNFYRFRTDHNLLGDGPDAAQERSRQHSGDRKSDVIARAGRKAALVPVPGTAMCKGIARWVSLSGRRKRFWTDWEPSSVLSRPVTMGSTRCGQFRRCTTLRARFFALGGNFLSATPDTEYTAEALRRCG